MKKLISTLLFIFATLAVMAQAPAFPGAQGFGRYVTGGRGGKVIHVTNLNDSGKGSLREALQNTSGARIIVFDVSGTIELESRMNIRYGDVTVMGQTAPGDGICLKNYETVVNADNVIIRFMRFRLGTDRPDSDGTIDRDAFWGREKSSIIIDHCSTSWSTDECMSFYDNSDFTLQWCIIAESLRHSIHPKGSHGYGAIWGGQGASFHHNLMAHNDSRNPRMCGSRYSARPDLELVDLRNCVFYNWGSTNSGYAGEGGSYNFVNNYYKSGPATKTTITDRIFQPGADDGSNAQEKGVYGTFYVNGNYVNGYGSYYDWSGIDIDKTNNSAMTEDAIKSTTEFEVDEVTTHTAEKAYEKVLAYAGASYSRDAVDAHVVANATSGSYSYGNYGIIDSPADVGGWPTLNSTTRPTDTDEDGIPDDWETENDLNPNDASDAITYTLDPKGYYTNIEVYCNSLVQDIMIAGYKDAAITTAEYYPAYVTADGDPVAEVNIEASNGNDSSQEEVATGSIRWTFDDGTLGDAAIASSLTDYISSASMTIGSNLTILGTRDVNDLTMTELQSTARESSAAETNNVKFSITTSDGYYFTPSTVSFNISKIGTGNGVFDLTWSNSSSLYTIESDHSINRNGESYGWYTSYSKDLSSTVAAATGESFMNLYIYDFGSTTDGQFSKKSAGLCNITIEGKISKTGSTGINGVQINTAVETDGAIYNLQGQKVDDSYKGLVIKNGRKYIKK